MKSTLIIFLINYVSATIQLDLQGPVFSHEPLHKVEFSNSTGGHIECSGHGSPQPEVCIVLCNFPLPTFSKWNTDELNRRGFIKRQLMNQPSFAR